MQKSNKFAAKKHFLSLHQNAGRVFYSAIQMNFWSGNINVIHCTGILPRKNPSYQSTCYKSLFNFCKFNCQSHFRIKFDFVAIICYQTLLMCSFSFYIFWKGKKWQTSLDILNLQYVLYDKLCIIINHTQIFGFDSFDLSNFFAIQLFKFRIFSKYSFEIWGQETRYAFDVNFRCCVFRPQHLDTIKVKVF